MLKLIHAINSVRIIVASLKVYLILFNMSRTSMLFGNVKKQLKHILVWLQLSSVFLLVKVLLPKVNNSDEFVTCQ